MPNIHRAWLRRFENRLLGPTSVIREFLTRAVSVGSEVVPHGYVVSCRDALVVYLLVRSRGYSAGVKRISALTGMNTLASVVVADGLRSKGLVSVSDEHDSVVTLTDKGLELVERCAAAGEPCL